MLYISNIADDIATVSDTDDGSEEQIKIRGQYNSLEYCVCTLGMKISGARVSTTSVGRRILIAAEVVIPDSSLSVAQIKLRSLTGVDIRVGGNRIVSISCQSGLYVPEVRVRLSDYGVVCCNYMLRDVACKSTDRLILVLDDKLSFEENAFKGDKGFYLDVRDVTRKDSLDFIYNAFARTSNRFAIRGFDFIIDHGDRLNLYKAEFVISRGINMPDVTSDEDIAHKVYVHYAREFKSLMSMQFMLRTFDDEDIAEYIPQQRDKLLEYKKYDGDFNHLLSVFSPTFVHFFECFLVYDMSSDGVRRLNHYLMFFEVPEDIKRNFLDMCHRLFEFLESLV